MFDTSPDVLDADGVLSDVVAARAASDRCEVRVLEDALRWAYLHGTVERAATTSSTPPAPDQPGPPHAGTGHCPEQRLPERRDDLWPGGLVTGG